MEAHPHRGKHWPCGLFDFDTGSWGPGRRERFLRVGFQPGKVRCSS